MPLTWWLRSSAYRRYMLRELTCLLIGGWCGWLILGLVSLSRGGEAWRSFVEGLASAPGILFQVLVLVAAVYHSVTWFALAPRTMPLRLAGRPIPAIWITLGHYIAAALVAVLLLILARV